MLSSAINKKPALFRKYIFISFFQIKLEETELNGRSNQSACSVWIYFLGLCDSWELQAFLLVIFSSLYLITILGNIFIVLLITADLHLHCPMYFLLANLSCIDLCLSSVTTPKMITDFLKANKTISFGSCMCQIFFGHFFGGEMVLLVSMAYDRYVAICKPLHYSSIMNTQTCIRLVMTSWIIGFVHSISQLAIIVQLPFCGPRELDSFSVIFHWWSSCLHGHLCFRNVDECWQWGTCHHLLHSTADLLLLYSAYSLPSVEGWGIQGALHLHCPHHSSRVILWALYLHLPVSTQHHLGGQVSCCILCSHHTTTKSSHLHFKQRH